MMAVLMKGTDEALRCTIEDCLQEAGNGQSKSKDEGCSFNKQIPLPREYFNVLYIILFITFDRNNKLGIIIISMIILLILD